MSIITIRLRLNPGRIGMPLDKLARICGDFVGLLDSLAQDLGAPKGKHVWRAANFQNKSVQLDVDGGAELSGLEDNDFERSFSILGEPENASDPLSLRLSHTTRARFCKTFSHLDADEVAFVGIVKGSQEPEMLSILQTSSPRLVDGMIDRNEYGEIQGSVHSLVKGAPEPYLEVRELSTKSLVKCFFKPEQYQKAVELLEDSDAIVFVEGWLRLDPETEHVKRIQVEGFRLVPAFDLDGFRASYGSIPDFELAPFDGDRFV